MNIKYEYIVRVRALDMLANIMKADGVSIPPDFGFVRFKSPKLLNMRTYQANGLISSYIIIRNHKMEEVVEDWFGEAETIFEPLHRESDMK